MPLPNNSISSISPDFRENLLNRNILSRIIDKANLSGYLQNIGKFASISSIPNKVNRGEDIETLGSLFRKDLITKNKIQPEEHNFTTTNITTNPFQGEIEGIYNIDSAKLLDSDDQGVIRDTNLMNNVFISENPELDIRSINNIPIPKSQSGQYNPNQSKLLDSTTSINARENNSLKNKYYDPQLQTVGNISVELVEPTTQFKNYIDRVTNMSNVGLITSPATILNNLLGGLSPNNISTPNPYFDVQSVLRGRDLSMDTELGIIGNERLGFHLQQNIAFNTRRETIGRVNTNPNNFLLGGSLIQPDYSITVSKSGGLALSYAERILGFNIPVSLISSDASIFSKESGDIGNIARTSSLLSNTGSGQRQAMLSNISQNRYIPGYKFNDVELGTPNVYAYYTSDGDVLSLSPMNKFISGIDSWNSTVDFPDAPKGYQHGFEDPLTTIAGSSGLSPRIDSTSHPKSILSKTKRLFEKGYLKTMITTGAINVSDDFISSNVDGYMSKGSAVKTFDGILPLSGVFSRTYDLSRKYDTVNRLQKHSGIGIQDGINQRRNINDSVLEDTGFVKMTPYKGEVESSKLKKYMFSIENLAWADNNDLLLPEEIGNGDPDLGGNKKGRIMWFPPYDISFTDNTSVDWEKTNFIGRGEPIYTYNNTVRTGNLQFKIIIDHPSYMNDDNIKRQDDDVLSALMAGTANIDAFRFYTSKELEEINEYVNNPIKESGYQEDNIPDEYLIYFPPLESDVQLITISDYENGTSVFAPYAATSNNVQHTYVINDDGLNAGVVNRINDIAGDIEKCKSCKIVIEYVSEISGIGKERAESVKNRFNSFTDDRFKLIDKGVTSFFNQTIDPNTVNFDKRFTFVKVRFEPDPSLVPASATGVQPTTNSHQTDDSVKRLRRKSTYEEKDFFEKIGQDDKFVYDKIRDSLKHFHPAFHSITPEGFNSRLNFLHQCTRQGPTKSKNNPDNLAFGRPPVCILRLGDFYFTKIVIDSLNMSFDPLVWDLNPEGVGVQPMICTVDLNFAFIGGSSLQGPISRLNNAVSFEFFANTQIYDDRAAYYEGGKLVNHATESYTVETSAALKEAVETDQEAVADQENNTPEAAFVSSNLMLPFPIP